MRPRPLAAIALILVVLAACADAPTDPGNGDGIAHGTAPDDLLLRVSWEGGFVPIEWSYTNLPVFSLYGDGTVVVPGAQIEIYPAPALPAISTRAVDEAAIQAILREAITATADLPDDLGDMGSVGIADAATTVITVSAGDVDRTIRVYALGDWLERPDGMPADVFDARQRLQRLVTRLGSLDPWMPDGSLGPEESYRASGARIFVSPYRKVDDLSQPRTEWPLPQRLTGFGEPTDPSSTYRCGVVEGEDWVTVHADASRANQLTPWHDAGSRFSILFRPLLPDETGC